jgi:hypothetical protein
VRGIGSPEANDLYHLLSIARKRYEALVWRLISHSVQAKA